MITILYLEKERVIYLVLVPYAFMFSPDLTEERLADHCTKKKKKKLCLVNGKKDLDLKSSLGSESL